MNYAATVVYSMPRRRTAKDVVVEVDQCLVEGRNGGIPYIREQFIELVLAESRNGRTLQQFEAICEYMITFDVTYDDIHTQKDLWDVYVCLYTQALYNLLQS